MKESILKLREDGKSYREIEKILGCSRSTISYHLNEKTRIKNKERQKNRRKDPIKVKIDTFRGRKKIKNACEKFQLKTSDKDENGNTIKFMKMKDTTIQFKPSHVIDKFGTECKCYLSGRSINLHDGQNYSFDHIIPVSRGGDNSLDNLGIAHPSANYAKGDLMVDEFLQLCKEILNHNGFTVIDPN